MANDDTDVSFTYTVTDGIANVAGSATLDITPVNDIPTNTPVVLTPVAEEDTLRVITEVELLANAADIDNVSLTASSLQASSGTLTDNNDGTWDFTPAANDDTDVSFTYTVTDGVDDVAGSATLDITPVNDIPTNTPVVLTPVVEDNLRVITEAELLANAADIDNVSLTASNLQASSGTLTDNNDGTWDFTPAANDDTDVSFTYTVTCLLYTSPSPRDRG